MDATDASCGDNRLHSQDSSPAVAAPSARTSSAECGVQHFLWPVTEHLSHLDARYFHNRYGKAASALPPTEEHG